MFLISNNSNKAFILWSQVSVYFTNKFSENTFSFFNEFNCFIIYYHSDLRILKKPVEFKP